jgi:hypothetical protein
MKNTQSPSMLGRQILGAGIGMLVAGAVYLVVENISTQSLSGLLVGTSTISENAGQIRVNDKNIDDEALRRLQTNARKLVAATEEATGMVTSMASSVSTLIARTEERAMNRTRRFNDDGTPIVASVATTTVDEGMHSGAPKEVGVFVEEAVRTLTVSTPNTTEVSKLPNSGMGTAVLVVLSGLGALAFRRRARA